MKNIIDWWNMGLPHENIRYRKKGENTLQRIKDPLLIWFWHPVKRRVAKYYLSILQRYFGLTVIGITGSAGKTTTKDMLESILKLDGVTLSSYANIDPVYNLPRTIIKARPKTKYLILELGVEYPGDMDFYMNFVKPQIGIITNINPTHTLFLKNIEGVAKEKTKLIKNLPAGGIAVLNCDDRYLLKLIKYSVLRVVWFGQKAVVKAKEIRFNQDMSTTFTLTLDKSNISIQLPVLGTPFVDNALAAAACAWKLGCNIENIAAGLNEYRIQPHRMNIFKTNTQATIVDDSYNNNPVAAKRTLETFAVLAEKKAMIIVFGDMLELGELEVAAHRDIGKTIASINPKKLICVGKASKITASQAVKVMGKNKVEHTQSLDQAYDWLEPLLDSNTSVLIKGSRSIGLDKLVLRLKRHLS